MKNTLWYFPLEVIKSRYTEQLCKQWMPALFKEADWNDIMVTVGQTLDDHIQTGQVLDATGRGTFALTQCSQFLHAIRSGQVKDGDVLYYQDFWTPGIDAINYALHLHGIKVKQYAMCHAQSVDEFDFTHAMLPWIRHYELGHDAVMNGIFVASTIHQDQLKKAGFRAPIHVVGLPIDETEVQSHLSNPIQKENAVIFSSRFDKEKNPVFMLRVAAAFLAQNPTWEWWITTSAPTLRSNDPQALGILNTFQKRIPRLKIFTDLSKDEYYERLSRASIQFNSSLQDYVSWTLLEATIAECALVYPEYRSFPECVEKMSLYRAFDINDAVGKLQMAVAHPASFRSRRALHASQIGRSMINVVLQSGTPVEVNVWEAYR